jgi:hypothetical protein
MRRVAFRHKFEVTRPQITKAGKQALTPQKLIQINVAGFAALHLKSSPRLPFAPVGGHTLRAQVQGEYINRGRDQD